MTHIWSRWLERQLRRDERSGGESGDVPGWVLITVMTAGLVGALWSVAGSQLSAMLRSALASVSG